MGLCYPGGVRLDDLNLDGIRPADDFRRWACPLCHASFVPSPLAHLANERRGVFFLQPKYLHWTCTYCHQVVQPIPIP